MSATRVCRVSDLKPGMVVYAPSLGRDARVAGVEAEGDEATVWLSIDGCKPFPFPFHVDDEVSVDEAGQ